MTVLSNYAQNKYDFSLAN